MRFNESAGKFRSETHQLCRASRQLYKKIYTHRKVRSPQQTSIRGLHLLRHHRKRFKPSRSSDDDRHARLEARENVRDCCIRLRELDRNIRITKCTLCYSASVDVVLRVQHRAHAPTTLLHKLRDSTSHLAVANDCDLGIVSAHAVSLPKNSRCSRSIAPFTSSPSTITVRLMPVALSDIMCTFVSPSAMSALPIAPPASHIPAPTIAMMPRFLSLERSPSERRSTSNSSSREGSSIVTETDTSEVATTSTEV